MEAKTSTKQTTPSSQLNSKIAKGKRKEDCGRLALSLQDVFSDSANLEGMQQKTSRPFKSEQGKEAQLQEKGDGKARRNIKGGRKKLQPNQRRTIKLQVHVTNQEFDQIESRFHVSGERYLSDYLRILILDERKSVSIINKKDLIKQLDRIGVQIHRIGNNINQIAKYANIQLKSGKIDQRTLDNFNFQMEQYLKEKQNLVKAYRALTRNKG